MEGGRRSSHGLQRGHGCCQTGGGGDRVRRQPGAAAPADAGRRGGSAAQWGASAGARRPDHRPRRIGRARRPLGERQDHALSCARGVVALWPRPGRAAEGRARLVPAAEAVSADRLAQGGAELPRDAPSVMPRRRAGEVLEACALGHLAHRLDETANWSLALSGGEQQRLAFARALLYRPDWLLLDEASSALDVAAERRMYRLLAERLPGAAVISVAHRPEVLALPAARQLPVEGDAVRHHRESVPTGRVRRFPGYHAAVLFPRTDERFRQGIVNAIAGDRAPCSDVIVIRGIASG